MYKSLFAALVTLWSANALAAPGHQANGTQPANEAKVDRVIQVEAEEMIFGPEALTIASGETVKFEIHNSGALAHEFVIGDRAAQEEHRRMMQEMGGHGHGHGDHGGHDMAEGEHGGNMPAVTIAPGETATLVWTAPEGASQLEYACNIPGHYEAGMVGQIDLEG
ncbi:copper-binding protein [Billgrantia antri]|uniref:Copper-binding protein n=1 Tax=Halomonas sulfidivorans TaxID=2733488 RepID=A0ABX7WDS8_9GAMM|nr:plastocyanin/azurin family copper-binding protein [Halomonas sulfidivorans]QTP58450.1 copper-binding protein [Halomonas sulfidivorans]